MVISDYVAYLALFNLDIMSISTYVLHRFNDETKIKIIKDALMCSKRHGTFIVADVCVSARNVHD